MVRLRPLDPVGLAGAFLFAGACLTPSLLPRAAVIAGAVAGIGAGIGYALATTAAWILRAGMGRARPWRLPRAGWLALSGAGAAGVALMVWRDLRWQGQLHTAAGLAQPGWEWFPVSLGTAIGSFLLVLGLARAIRVIALAAGGAADRAMAQLLPARRARLFIWSALGLAAGFAVVSGALGAASYPMISAAFAAYDSAGPAAVPPVSPSVSGSPGSAVRWDDLGRGGRNFISAVPTRDQLTAPRSQPAKDPIRVFVGMRSAPDDSTRAALAVAELDRLGAFQRKVLLIANSAGSGIVDESGVRPLEFMYGGDTAIVSTQYSYLPSWLSFLLDQSASAAAGRALYQAVHDHWQQLPADSRPKLVVFGESLGAYSGQAPFPTPADLLAGADGALFEGSPAASALHASITAARAATSTQWLPVYDSGRHIRFAGPPADLADPADPWRSPRVGYLQNATDPVVWWSPRLIWARPDWLREPRGPAVIMSWLPLITFLQVSGDMVDSTSVPFGFGHVYGPHGAAAWAAVLPPPGWTAADTAALGSP